MTTNRRFTGATLTIALMSASLHAQEISTRTTSPYLDERTGIGLDDAIARALAHEPGLRAARSDIDVARGQQQQASLRANPTVTFERRQEPGGTDTLTAIGVTWPLELFRRRGREETAQQELLVTQLSVADRERLLASDVRLQYGIAAAAARDVSVADELVTTLERQVELARARANEGALPLLDRNLLEVEVRRLRAERAGTVGRAEVAMLLLKRLLGMGPDEALRLREPLDALLVRAGSAAPATVAPSGDPRADVREAEARVQLADARADQARRDGRMDVSLFGSYMRMDAGFPQSGVGPSGALERVRGQFNYWSAGVMVALPLFNRSQGDVARAQAEHTGAAADLDATALTARSEVAAARARDRRAQDAVALYEGDTRVLARQNLDVVRQTFDLGRATVFDVLAEQRRYLEFERAYTAALREAWEARAALARAVGDTK